MIDYILNNKEWIFSGVGLSVISLLIWLVRCFSSKAGSGQVMKVGKGGAGYQAGRDIKIYKDK